MKITNNTVVIVTGSTRGLGRALIEDLAKKGAKVYGTYKSSQTEAHEIEARFPNIHMYAVDNAKPEQIEEFIKIVLSKETQIDIHINNAGSVHQRKPIVDLPIENWKSLLDVHLTGAFIFCKNVLPIMQKRNQGLIINVSSRFGLFENAKSGSAALNVAKVGLNMLTKILAKELEGTEIRVNSVLPAPTLTDFVAEIFTTQEIDGMKQKGILGQTSDFVELVNEVIENDEINGEFVLDKRLRNQ